MEKKDYQFYLNKIVEFNSDKELLALHEQYSEPSFFEIISKTRSETTYSSFLKWLLQTKSPHDEIISPVMMLLDILIKRSFQQKPNLINETMRNAVLTRKMKIQNVQVETEKQVGILALEAYQKETAQDRKDFLNNIHLYCQDRIDIFVECDTEINNGSKKLQIIIENKIDSSEGNPRLSGKKIPDNLKNGYYKYPQTTRYYIGTHRTDDSICQLYIYLTPLSSHRLDNFQELKKEQEQYDEDKKKSIRVLCEDENFIQINYQDILDGIVIPLLSSPSLPERNRFFLEEFKNELMFPNIEDFNEQSCIAISKDTSEIISGLWRKYDNLIIDAIMASTLANSDKYANFWTVDGIYYDHQPKLELLKIMNEMNLRTNMKDNKGQWLADKSDSFDPKKFGELEDNLLYRKGILYSNIIKFAQDNGISINGEEKGINLGFKSNSEECKLLSSFYDENSNFIYAFMNAIKEDERKKINCFFNYLNKKDRTKYTLYYQNKLQGANMGYTATAFMIIKLWAERNKDNLTGSPAQILEKINKAFPRRINKYYERGKWFKNLIYEYRPNGDYQYDDKFVGPVEANWDFYKPDSRIEHHFTINDAEITVLKMWHEIEVESLIEHIGKRYYFGKDLQIIRS